MSSQDLRMQVIQLRKQVVKIQKDAKEREDKLFKTLLMFEPFLSVLSEVQLKQLHDKIDEYIEANK